MSRPSTLQSHIFSLGHSFSQAFFRVQGKIPILTTIRSVRDIDEDSARPIFESYAAINPKECLLESLPGINHPALKTQLYDISTSGRTTFTAYHTQDGKPIIEISSKSLNFKIDASSLHGKFQNDIWFSGVSWSADEQYVAYVANPKDGKSPSKSLDTQFERNELASNGENSKFDFKDDWGEKFEGVSVLVIAVLDTYNGKIRVFNADSSCTIGCPVFHPHKLELLYTQWSTKPRRLGLLHCHQRPSALYVVDITDVLKGEDKQTITLPSSAETSMSILNPVCLSSGLAVARLGRFSPNGEHLVVLGRQQPASTHNACYELYRHDRSNKTTKQPTLSLLVPIVQYPKTKFDFPGLFVDQIPQRCFADDSHIVLNSGWYSTESVIQINIHSGAIVRLNPLITEAILGTDSVIRSNDSSYASCNMLECTCDPTTGIAHIVCSTSTPCSPPRICVVQIDGLKTHVWKTLGHPKFMSVSSKTQFNLAADSSGRGDVTIDNNADIKSEAERLTTTLSSMKWKVIEYLAKNDDEESRRFEAILLLPPSLSSDGSVLDNASVPLIVVPHGGPHSAITTTFMPSYAFLSISMQAAILFVNYRGSTNFGQSALDSLPGRIGTNDVQDMVQSIEELSSAYTAAGGNSAELRVDTKKLAVVGGSHGGFLGAHLIGQYPSLFRCAVLRNPVTNIVSMTTFSDIPDWCFVESGGVGSYDFSTTRVPSPAELVVMHSQSPIRYIDRVVTPTLLCIGQKDKRVPPGQGYEYYHLLKARGVQCHMLSFPEDSHALDRPLTEAEQWSFTVAWMRQHFQ